MSVTTSLYHDIQTIKERIHAYDGQVLPDTVDLLGKRYDQWCVKDSTDTPMRRTIQALALKTLVILKPNATLSVKDLMLVVVYLRTMLYYITTMLRTPVPHDPGN